MPEKEYVLGNKTKDLLVYSFVVTKPISDKTVNVGDAVKFLARLSGLPEEEKAKLVESASSSLAGPTKRRASRRVQSTHTSGRAGRPPSP